jgi:hypothetical protein
MILRTIRVQFTSLRLQFQTSSGRYCAHFGWLTQILIPKILGLAALTYAQSVRPAQAAPQPSWQEWIKTHPTYPNSPAPNLPPPRIRPSSPTSPVTPLYKTPSPGIVFKDLQISGVSFYVATIDLADPAVLISVGLPQGADRANSSRISHGDEAFSGFVDRLNAAVVINGTFFGLDGGLPVMGNLISGGQALKYVPWENYGTTLGIGAGKRPEMVTARLEGKPNWRNHWFSITAGPRLLRRGQVVSHARAEGFSDRGVLGVARRSAIGYSAEGRHLILVAFRTPVSLATEASLMQILGCTEAMNLDGGSSVGFAHQGRLLVSPGRGLTNVIAVYNRQYPAAPWLQNSWQRFNQGYRQPFPSVL